jgi:anti-anti-sigma factor
MTAVVRLSGEHDMSTTPAVEGHLDELIAEGRAITIDLGALTFIDSTVIAALLAARDRSREAGTDLTLAVPASTAPAVRKVVQLTGLAEAIKPGEDDTEGGEAVA